MSFDDDDDFGCRAVAEDLRARVVEAEITGAPIPTRPIRAEGYCPLCLEQVSVCYLFGHIPGWVCLCAGCTWWGYPGDLYTMVQRTIEETLRDGRQH